MKISLAIKAFLLALGISFASTQPVQAAGTNCSSQGIACVSGGIGGSEREELQQQAKSYSLWVNTVANKSGAYLADIRVTVRNAKNHEMVLTATMDGPWLFIALPAGRYEVEAKYHDPVKNSDQVVKKITDIKAGDHRQMLMYFDASNVGRFDYETSSKP